MFLSMLYRSNLFEIFPAPLRYHPPNSKIESKRSCGPFVYKYVKVVSLKLRHRPSYHESCHGPCIYEFNVINDTYVNNNNKQ